MALSSQNNKERSLGYKKCFLIAERLRIPFISPLLFKELRHKNMMHGIKYRKGKSELFTMCPIFTRFNEHLQDSLLLQCLKRKLCLVFRFRPWGDWGPRPHTKFQWILLGDILNFSGKIERVLGCYLKANLPCKLRSYCASKTSHFEPLLSNERIGRVEHYVALVWEGLTL